MLSFIMGEKFIHNKFGDGVVVGVDNCNVTIRFREGERNFVFPNSFNGKYMSAEDNAVQKQLESLTFKAREDLEKQKVQKDEEKAAEAQKTSLGSVARFMTTGAGKRLAEVKIGDQFDNIKDVMDNVFGWNYKQYMRGFYYLDDSKRFGAWFPKFSKDNKTPADLVLDWLNILTPDWKYIYMKNNDISRMNSIDRNYPVHFTFGKLPGKKYQYIGAFKCTHIDSELGYVFERIDLQSGFRALCFDCGAEST